MNEQRKNFKSCDGTIELDSVCALDKIFLHSRVSFSFRR